MKLYHFTAEHHLNGAGGHAGPGIMSFGLAPNSHPLIAILTGVWLTADGSWSQLWAPRPVPFPDGSTCDRTEVRLEIAIPKSERDALWPLSRVEPFIRADWRADFTLDVTPESWWLFLGRIPAGWIRSVERRP